MPADQKTQARSGGKRFDKAVNITKGTHDKLSVEAGRRSVNNSLIADKAIKVYVAKLAEVADDDLV